MDLNKTKFQNKKKNSDRASGDLYLQSEIEIFIFETKYFISSFS